MDHCPTRLSRQAVPGDSLTACLFLVAACGWLTLINLLCAQSTGQWKKFISEKYHFVVEYPGSWYRLSGASDILDITNFERSGPSDGIATRVAGAEITVTGALPGIRNADDWIRRDLPDSDDIAASENNLKIPTPDAAGCSKLKQASWREQLSPDAFFAETSYYCTSAGGLYKVSLLNWQNDPRQQELRELAISIATSLRTHAAH